MKLRYLALFTAAAFLLAACSQALPQNQQSQDEAQAQSVILSAVDEALEARAAEDGTDLSAQSLSPGLSAQSVEPFIVIRRTGMRHSRQLISLNVDFVAKPPTAVAIIELNLSGTAKLWQVYPDGSVPRTLLGEKPIDMSGELVVTAQKLTDGWRVVSVEPTALSQGEYAATVETWSVDPDPLIPGYDDNKAFASLSEADNDEFLVTARGRHLRARGVLNDNGVLPDEIANDDDYAGFVEVGPDARPGYHLAFLHALNYSKTTDLSVDENGDFIYPYTDTLLPLTVEIVETD